MLVSPAINGSLEHGISFCFSNFEAYLLLTRYNMLMIKKKLKWFKCSLSFLSFSPPQRQYVISVPFWVHTHKVFINTAFCKSTPLKNCIWYEDIAVILPTPGPSLPQKLWASLRPLRWLKESSGDGQGPAVLGDLIALVLWESTLGLGKCK